MKNTEPGQIAKAKEQTKSIQATLSFNPSNAYKDLNTLYENVKNNIEIYSTVSGRVALSKELDFFKDILFNYLMTSEILNRQKVDIKSKIEYLFNVIKGRDLNELNLNYSVDLQVQKPMNYYSEIKAFYQQCENLKTSINEPGFKDFFKGLDDDDIDAVYNEFNNCSGKPLAALIDLLQTEKGGLNIIYKDKSGYSLEDFIRYFHSKDPKGTTKYLKFDNNDNVERRKDDDIRRNYISDNNKQQMRERLNNII